MEESDIISATVAGFNVVWMWH